jgi:hypothetical protein
MTYFELWVDLATGWQLMATVMDERFCRYLAALVKAQSGSDVVCVFQEIDG